MKPQMQQRDLTAELSLSQIVTLACMLEVSAPKPGNVHRGADFADMTFDDFLWSATAVGAPLARAAQLGVGGAVEEAIRQRTLVTNANTNLGLVLLMAPLAAVPLDTTLPDGISSVLATLTAEDSRAVYRAIQQAHPGGLGESDEMDIRSEAPTDLLRAMQCARERDMVARQYCTGFRDILQDFVPWLLAEAMGCGSLSAAIVRLHVRIMAEYPDSLIQRKCGREIAEQSAAMANGVLNAPDEAAYHEGLADLDFWLRADGNRRNPGTTADLVGASLFAALRDKQLPLERVDWEHVES